MKTINLTSPSLFSRLFLGLIFLSSVFSVELEAQVCRSDTSFTDILFVIDNSGSIDDTEYDLFSDIILSTITEVQGRCQSSQIGVMHYGGAFGTETFVEYNFSRINQIADITRQYCTSRNQFGFCSGGGGDDLNAAMGDVVSMIQNGTLNRRPINKLALVIFTDAFGFEAQCPFENCSVLRPFTNIDILKSQYNAQVTVVGASSQAEASLLAIYASPGGTFDNVDLFPQDCPTTFDGCQLPRKYIPIEFDSPLAPTSDSIAVCVNCTVEIIGGVMADAGLDQTLCEENDGIATLTAQLINGTAPFTYEWDNGLGSGNDQIVSPTLTTTYTVTITDANGCSSADQLTITIEDCFPDCQPILTCPDDYEGCPLGSMDPMITGMATAVKVDSTCEEPVITYTDDVMPFGTCEGQVIIMRTWVATDGSNSDIFSTCTQRISLIDTIAPNIIACPPSTILNPDNPVHEWEDPVVEENCGFTLSYSVPNGSIFLTGQTKVIATATDMCGNIDTCSFIVTVPEEVEIICTEIVLTCIDTLLPSMIPDIETNSPCDQCEADPDNCVQTNASIDSIYKAGENTIYQVTYIATDLCGTDDTCTTNIIIDNSAQLDCPDNLTIQAPPFGFTNVTWEKPLFETCCTTCKTREIPGFLYMGQLGDSYYYCSYARVNWSRAQRTAEQNGGNLAVINSAEENEFIGRRLIERNAYIGLHDSDQEGDFTWVNGDPLNFTKWKRNQPDDMDGEDFVEMDAQGYWFDVDGKTKREFVMEIEGCDQVTQTSGPKPGSRLRVGTTTITYRAEDGCGNVDSCSFDIVLTPYSSSPIFITEKTIDPTNLVNINPNPASSTLYIDAVANDLIESIQVYQINGQVIDKRNNLENASISLDVSNYQSGLHLVRVTHSSGTVSIKKIVIE